MNESGLTIVSKRDHRDFDPTPLPADLVRQILEFGRLAGSARNLQPWRFLVATTLGVRSRLAPAVYVPQLVQTAPLVVAIAVDTQFSQLALMDAGRAAQNMMIGAWGEGVVSCPNGVADPTPLQALGVLTDTEIVPTLLAFGFPRIARDPTRRSAERWIVGARRRPIDEVVVSLDDVAT
jgi:nitroreductase